eukprot:Opistho-2@13087
MTFIDVLVSPFVWVVDALLDTVQFLLGLIIALPILLFKLATRGPKYLSHPLHLWNTLSPLPFGAHLFSCIIGAIATYTASISPRVVSLTSTSAVVRMTERPWLRNPFASIHAVALINLAECASGLAVLSGLPKDVRGIPVGISMKYDKKSRGRITATCELNLPQFEGETDYNAVSTLKDAAGDVVAVATVQWKLRKSTPKTAAASSSSSSSSADKSGKKKK